MIIQGCILFLRIIFLNFIILASSSFFKFFLFWFVHKFVLLIYSRDAEFACPILATEPEPEAPEPQSYMPNR